MYCPNCGRQIPDNSKWCPNCGQGTQRNQPVNNGGPFYPQPQPIAQPNPYPYKEDEPSTGLNVISFLFPIAGWILYFVFKEDRPNRARACSRWGWIGFGVGFVLYLIFIILIVAVSA